MTKSIYIHHPQLLNHCPHHHPQAPAAVTSVLKIRSHVLESKRGEWKRWLKVQHSENEDHGIWSHHSMGNRWGNSGNCVRLYFFGSRITADGDCSHEMKRCLLLGRKVMTNLDITLKSRHITLLTKVHLDRAVVFPVVMYGCEIWTIKKAEHKRMMLLNCGVGEDSWESLGLQGDETSQS